MQQQGFSLILICLAHFILSTDSSANFHVADSVIVDDAGRIRVYHGVNFVQKGFPWYPPDLLDESNVASLAEAGINFMRLGWVNSFELCTTPPLSCLSRMMWAGVEPQPKEYNITYVNIMQQIVQLLGSHGIYVLLDMHQDVLSSRTGSYDGIPAWLYDRFPAPQHPCKFLSMNVRSFYFESLGIRTRSLATEETTFELV